MIETPTVLILGAGASQPYEFPSGQELIKKIIEITLDPNSELFHNLLSTGFYKEDFIQSFGGILRFAKPPSIDLFLKENEQFAEIGKLSIAAALLPCENYDHLISETYDDGWYEYIYHRLLRECTFNNFTKNKLDIITFNYDRSLEVFLWTVFLGFYKQSEENALRILKHINIIHVYGSLGPLSWQTDNADAVIDYNGRVNTDCLQKCAKLP